MNDAMRAGTVTITGHEKAELEAYLAYPLHDGPRGGVVVIHHMPGYDEATREIVRRFAARGYAAICPNLYSREGAGVAHDDQAAAARAKGGIPDEQLVGDVAGAVAHLNSLDHANGKIGVIGYCSGGRQTFLAACSLPLDAAVDCYGAFVASDSPAGYPLQATSLLSKAPDLSCPLLGLFGAEDAHPSPEEVARLSAELDRLGKEHEFHVFPDAGHGFFGVDRPGYRPAAAAEGWKKVFAFFGRHLGA
ncbi:carboxymethylenebutenolidase [Sphaerisporangium siamense]|uniref:Carboxymethylenebutenolidase n=1 Tax=Sphaerisporangium siamense TaxID=795645 RepID=A0A7W7D2C6_9ACTN|nr:dienelactone hydrolase family protein [Sphaerisporangium siamense]MBB4698937.1 carboxymethylenebutenolidase [Sphaerisporangium siamense]GII88538.1 carboxymethylenebutenolidase [Sphaerisporangium siamense]